MRTYTSARTAVTSDRRAIYVILSCLSCNASKRTATSINSVCTDELNRIRRQDPELCFSTLEVSLFSLPFPSSVCPFIMATAATAPVFPPPRLVSLAEQVFELLKRRGEKVCVVETVGLLLVLPLRRVQMTISGVLTKDGRIQALCLACPSYLSDTLWSRTSSVASPVISAFPHVSHISFFCL